MCVVLTGGRLSSRKGIHAPRAILGMQVPTAKDRQDIDLAVELDVDFLAVSFVAQAEDVRQVRAAVKQARGEMPLISKIEREIALENFNRILEESDGIMVARGDLAVNISPEDVPRHQKAMIRACNQQGKPVICATQMLESMCAYPLPTRAEVSDVFNAILDGADAVMLSAESAAGDYPIEAVGMMARIVRSAERTMPRSDLAAESALPDQTPAIISHGISTMIERFNRHSGHITAILAVTRSGHTARMLARYRPGVPIIAANQFAPRVTPVSVVARHHAHAPRGRPAGPDRRPRGHHPGRRRRPACRRTTLYWLFPARAGRRTSTPTFWASSRCVTSWKAIANMPDPRDSPRRYHHSYNRH